MIPNELVSWKPTHSLRMPGQFTVAPFFGRYRKLCYAPFAMIMGMSSSLMWTCRTCGATHAGRPNSYSYNAPWTWYTIPEAERDKRSFLTEDYCSIDDEDFFVRGCLEIPIIGRESSLIWGVWVSLSRTNWLRERSLARDPSRTAEPAYFGWLASRIEIYPDTALLKTNVHTQPVGKRPLMELQPTDHPLALEQRIGISEERLMEVAELVEHKWRHPIWDKNHI